MTTNPGDLEYLSDSIRKVTVVIDKPVCILDNKDLLDMDAKIEDTSKYGFDAFEVLKLVVSTPTSYADCGEIYDCLLSMSDEHEHRDYLDYTDEQIAQYKAEAPGRAMDLISAIQMSFHNVVQALTPIIKPDEEMFVVDCDIEESQASENEMVLIFYLDSN